MEFAWAGFGVITAMSLVLPPTAYVAGLARRRYWQYQSRHVLAHHKTIIAEYEPPQNLTPAQIAYLYDQSFGDEEILATIFDLEQRGYVRLHTTRDPRDFVVTVQHTNGRHLESYEHELLLHIKHMRGIAKWSHISQEMRHFSTSFEKQLEESLRAKGLLLLQDDLALKHRAAWFGAGVCNAIVIILPGAITHDAFLPNDPLGYASLDRSLSFVPLFLLWAIATTIAGFSIRYAMDWHNRALHMKRGTGLLRFVWPQIEGYRLFVEQVELDAIQYANQHEAQTTKHKTLPYAIALNLSTNWHNRFR